MDMETRIKEILMRATPTNDNNHQNTANRYLQDKQLLSAIDIRGNNNVVIKIDWISFISVLFLICALIAHP